jgi:SAM-dependent methyltransferase
MKKLPQHYQDGGLSVEFYDLRERGGPGTVLDGDVEFYLAQARKTGGPVLDLACGTGRVALPLALAGFAVTGVERSPEMLAIARAKQRASGLATLKFVRGNMSYFQLGRRFALTIVAYRAFQHLLTAKEQRACLECVGQHLRRGGRLLVHLFDPKLESCAPGSKLLSNKRPQAYDPVSRRKINVEITDRSTDPVTQTFSETWRWTVTKNGSVIQTYDDVLRLRWTYRYEMRYLLELSGFRVLREYSDFKGSASRYGAEQVWVAEAI